MDDDRDSRSLSNGFAFLALAAGFMTICTSGWVQVAALLITFASGAGSVAALPKDPNDGEAVQDGSPLPPARSETPAASPQPTLTPEKSWVASLDKSSQSGRRL
jgi:hypothetical protein